MKNQGQINKMLLLIMAILTFFGGQGTDLFAQGIRTERVSFQRGTSSATIESSIKGDEIVDYLLNVSSGQYMNVSMATNNGANYFNIMEPGEEYVAVFNGSVNENQFEGATAKSGDYRIRVYLMRSAARRGEQANFRLEMIVSGSGNSENSMTSGDAKVAGTNFNATGNIPCSMGNGQPTGNCAFGIVRRGNGDADVQVTLSNGTIRYIYFQNGQAVGYDKSQADFGEFRASKESDLYIIHIGSERYEILEAIIYGG
jgi:hypothetical protein